MQMADATNGVLIRGLGDPRAPIGAQQGEPDLSDQLVPQLLEVNGLRHVAAVPEKIDQLPVDPKVSATVGSPTDHLPDGVLKRLQVDVPVHQEALEVLLCVQQQEVPALLRPANINAKGLEDRREGVPMLPGCDHHRARASLQAGVQVRADDLRQIVGIVVEMDDMVARADFPIVCGHRHPSLSTCRTVWWRVVALPRPRGATCGLPAPRFDESPRSGSETALGDSDTAASRPEEAQYWIDSSISLESFAPVEMSVDSAGLLRSRGVQVTAQRLAVLRAVSERPHSTTAEIARHVRSEIGVISPQAVYDALATLTDKAIIRRIQPAGSAARYEDRVADNHHHLICRNCGRMVDVDCAVGATPCLTAAEDAGYEIDEAEVIYWGRCPDCSAAAPPTDDHQNEPPQRLGGTA